jgi:AraC-like DNA-binding protein
MVWMAGIPAQALTRLRPYVRSAREEWRGPWTIARRRICDYLVVVVLEGSGRFALDDRTFPVASGDVVWFPPLRPHAMSGDAPRMRVLWAHFDLVWNPRRSPHAPITPSGMDDPRRIRRWLHPPADIAPIRDWTGKLPVANPTAIRDELRRLVAEDLGGRDPLIQAGGVLRLLGHLARGLAPRTSAARRHWQAMERAAEDLRAAPEDAPGIRALAARAGLSQAQFRRRFAEVHGESARRLLARARAQKARDLLLSGQRLSVGEIAAAVGFESVHSLSRAFRRAFGMPPTALLRERSL